ncbi:hypothetical protein BDB00DRAFT_943239 [Zychaea mexicana]|uniref:uncharacterized protein n=1 Tax=Zychaea mexicana TaxID=64656 RepID=UPI0022FE49C8|nr:uncharacterized protein BDB00DRAFT_943239 [Zychaea mexicana]KAI9482595.1 hypothetical protein BDB00DRAFT_943239 [Zychaea mexicana]
MTLAQLFPLMKLTLQVKPLTYKAITKDSIKAFKTHQRAQAEYVKDSLFWTNYQPDSQRAKVKLTFSVVWKLSSVDKVVDTWFGKTIVNSCAKVSYEDAQKVIDNQKIASIAEDDIRTGVEQHIRMLYVICPKSIIVVKTL